jgi:hypothetical protein
MELCQDLVFVVDHTHYYLNTVGFRRLDGIIYPTCIYGKMCWFICLNKLQQTTINKLREVYNMCKWQLENSSLLSGTYFVSEERTKIFLVKSLN